MDKPYFKKLTPEHFLWFLEDVLEAARLSELFGGAELLKVMALQISEINDLFDTNEADD